MSKLLKKDKGFTLIEVVIVLAIAALIILVVLQAVGSAQRANRDTARKSEGARMVSLLEQYASDNAGVYPTSANVIAAIKKYDPTLGAKYSVAAGAAPAYVQQQTASWADGACVVAPATGISSTNFTIVYVPSSAAAPRDYDLAVCTENGQSSMVHPQ